MPDDTLRAASLERIFRFAGALGNDALSVLQSMPRRRGGMTIYGTAADGRIVGIKGQRPLLLGKEQQEAFGTTALLLGRLQGELARLPQEQGELRAALERTASEHRRGKTRQRAADALRDGLHVLYDMSWEQVEAAVAEQQRQREEWRAGRPSRRAAAKAQHDAAIERMKNPPIDAWWQDPENQNWH